MLKVLAVCVNGMGSSLILRMTVEKAFQQLGIDAAVDHCDLGGYRGKTADVVVTTASLASSIPERDGVTIITIKNFVDVDGLKEKIKVALNLED
ncbi:MAG: PTS sugar transporter subunit IIB [Oscillospiraceae bacterium]|nr:PTS sugar transporter subunit IIB [Oscillospiraceae bacterium]